MKKILIALDYNPSAQVVAETGYALAKDMQAEVILLHVMADPGYYAAYEYSPIMGFNSNFIGPETLPPDATQELKNGANDFLSRSREHLGGTGITTLVLEGDTATTIVKAATDLNATIIVLGSHSRRGLEKILMGSVAEKVLHHSLIPLFIIPTKG
ncbi:MAG: universal stress protein [Chitinophagaceae bacterium]